MIKIEELKELLPEDLPVETLEAIMGIDIYDEPSTEAIDEAVAAARAEEKAAYDARFREHFFSTTPADVAEVVEVAAEVAEEVAEEVAFEEREAAAYEMGIPEAGEYTGLFEEEDD